MRFEMLFLFEMSVVFGTDCIGWCKSNY